MVEIARYKPIVGAGHHLTSVQNTYKNIIELGEPGQETVLTDQRINTPEGEKGISYGGIHYGNGKSTFPPR